jgi:hypothetical protein
MSGISLAYECSIHRLYFVSACPIRGKNAGASKQAPLPVKKFLRFMK